MTPTDFVYWLQGFLELQNPDKITKEQVEEIKRHIGLVLYKCPLQDVTNLKWDDEQGKMIPVSDTINWPFDWSHISTYVHQNSDKARICEVAYDKNTAKYTVEVIETLHSC